MASVRPRGGAFEARVRIKGFPTKSRTFDTEAQAHAWGRLEEARLLTLQAQGAPAPASPLFSTWIQRYINEVADRWATAKDKKQRLGALLKDEIAAVPVADLTPDHFELLAGRLAVSRKPQTVRHYLQDCSAVWQAARKRWRATKLANPLHEIEMPPVSPGRKGRVAPDLWDRILAHLRKHVNPFYAPYAEFLLETAMRVSEPLTLRVANIDFDGAVLHVTGKGGKERYVPLSEAAQRLLRHAIQLRKEVPCVGRAPDGGYYDLEGFDADIVWPLTYRGFYRAWRDARAAAGDNDVWIHDIRRERTTRLLAEGWDLSSVAGLSGHGSLQVLSRSYNAVRASELARRLDAKRPAEADRAGPQEQLGSE